MRKFIKTSLLIIIIFTNSCTKEHEIPSNIVEHDFVWKGLNAYYYWQSDKPDLADTRFRNQNQLNDFSQSFSSPEEIFENLLNKSKDRFSVIVNDYVALENSFQGQTLSNGMELAVFPEKDNSTNIYGVVRYVVPNSDAAAKGVLRGMVFNAVDNTQLTTNNFRNLLFGSNTDYTINLANFNEGNPVLNGNSISLSKSDLQENPVAIVKTFNEGARKIGYLLYNQFASNYDAELNAAFGTLKANGVTDLIVDLRYNGGGSVRTATYLGSMITKQSNETIFSQQVWNEKVMKVIPPSNLENYFTDQIRNIDENGDVVLEESINSLNLSSVYFIVSENTASASELVINALKPFIDVILIGTKTVGKHVGSITLYDSDNYRKNGANFNRTHNYAMQAIVLEIKNSKGENKPEGFEPDAEIAEDFGENSNNVNLGVLGEKSDPLLNRAINYINNVANALNKSSVPKRRKQITNSKLEKPFANEMYVDLKD
ncbi:S41 family peptidase [uncultured Polaribacter sp.]|uniref:S41 family peptidase n=1 Tax=uncultured Polaribacter sp. TaxID=174711 RepID=UPI0026093935|nr:S41 family peptidase [uncultured Polaribacter sp.]